MTQFCPTITKHAYGHEPNTAMDMVVAGNDSLQAALQIPPAKSSTFRLLQAETLTPAMAFTLCETLNVSELLIPSLNTFEAQVKYVESMMMLSTMKAPRLGYLARVGDNGTQGKNTDAQDELSKVIDQVTNHRLMGVAVDTIYLEWWGKDNTDLVPRGQYDIHFMDLFRGRKDLRNVRRVRSWSSALPYAASQWIIDITKPENRGWSMPVLRPEITGPISFSEADKYIEYLVRLAKEDRND